MSKETALEFMAMLDSSEELKKKLSDAERIEDIIAVAKEKGIEFTIDDWIEAEQSKFEAGGDAS